MDAVLNMASAAAGCSRGIGSSTVREFWQSLEGGSYWTTVTWMRWIAVGVAIAGFVQFLLGEA